MTAMRAPGGRRSKTDSIAVRGLCGYSFYTAAQRTRDSRLSPLSPSFLLTAQSRPVRLFFYFRLIDEHNGNIVADGINPFALDALEPTLVGFHLDLGLAQRADQNLQQIFTDGHGLAPV